MIKFTYGETCISAVKVKMSKVSKKKSSPTAIYIDGEAVLPTKRFWKSLQMRFRFNDNIFKYYEPEELFTRVAEKTPNARIRYTIERPSGALPRILAGVNPNGVCIPYNNLCEILNKYGHEGVSYSEGIVRSIHKPTAFSENGNAEGISICGDMFNNQFVVDCPIDGFGKPKIYLSLLREICKNGAVGFAPAFRSELVVGKKNDSVEFSLMRALESYNNEDGFIALQSRFKTAGKSWASVREALKLKATILKLYNMNQLRISKLILGVNSANAEFTGVEAETAKRNGNSEAVSDLPVFRELNRVIGNLNNEYGLANLDVLSEKKQRTLPACCTVYDLLNFASEIATHKATPYGNRMLQGYIGGLIQSEYDLEGTKDIYGDFRDFFVKHDAAISTKSQLDKMFEN